MPSLTKDSKGRSPFWVCCYRAADGRRLKKSTEQEDKTKAMEFCLALQRSEDLAGQGLLTETRARELIGEVLERTTGDKLPFFTAEGWLKDWLRGKEISKSENTHEAYSTTVAQFLKSLGGRSRLNIAAITSRDIQAFMDAQMKAEKSPTTVRNSIKHLRTAFNLARRQGVITVNPAEAVELPQKTKRDDGSEGTRDAFTSEQVAALLENTDATKAPEDWRGLILFAFYTGARLQDGANIQWCGIDLPGQTVTYRARKTGKLMTAPMHPALEAHLLSLHSPHSEKAFVFPKLANKDTAGKSGLSQTFRRIMQKAGVSGEVITAASGKGRTVTSLSFHSLRHAFNSTMANAGVAQEVRMKLTGHASEDVNRGYTHHELQPLRDAIGKLPTIGGGK